MSKKRPGENPSKEELQERQERQEFDQLYNIIDKEIEDYQGLNTTILMRKLEELKALKNHPGFTIDTGIRKTARLINKKLLEINARIADIIVEASNRAEASQAESMEQDDVAASLSPAEVIPDKYFKPNTELMKKCKRLIDDEFPPPEDNHFNPHFNPEKVYTEYLLSFKEKRIFTLTSYENEHVYDPANLACSGQTFIPDRTYDVGRYNDVETVTPANFHRKYYDQGDFDTKNLIRAINYRNIIENLPGSKIHLLISSYTYDPDPDDLQSQAEDDFYTIFTVYGIVKRMTAFFATGVIAPDMRYLRAFKSWVETGDDMGEPIITHLLLKRIGVMTELLWYILLMWPIKIFKSQELTVPANVKLYAGIGTSTRDANYQVFIASLFTDQVRHQYRQGVNCFHGYENPIYPDYIHDIHDITSRDFVSTAYSFDAATRFCKVGECQNREYCMLEFILTEGKTLPFIGSSANEAEVLLKPGNIYRFVKRYKVKYIREIHTGNEAMLIYIYQFLLIDDTNPFLPVVPLPLPPSPEKVSVLDVASEYAVPGPVVAPVLVPFDFSNHDHWSRYVNWFKYVFAQMAGIPPSDEQTQELLADFAAAAAASQQMKIAGSKTKTNKRRRQFKTKRRRTKRRRTKRRRSYRRKTNKRRI